MAAKDKTLLYMGIAGAAGLGLYVYFRNKHLFQAGAMIAPIKPSEPSIWEILLGSAKDQLAKGRLLDDAIKMRGEAHYKAWKAAVAADKPTYMVAGKTYETKTGVMKT